MKTKMIFGVMALLASSSVFASPKGQVNDKKVITESDVVCATATSVSNTNCFSIPVTTTFCCSNCNYDQAKWMAQNTADYVSTALATVIAEQLC